MTIKEAIKITLLVNENLLTPEEIKDYIIKNKLLSQNKVLLKDIKNNLTSKQDIYSFNGAYLFVPEGGTTALFRKGLEITEPNGEALKILNNPSNLERERLNGYFDFETPPTNYVFNYSDSRIRYVFFINVTYEMICRPDKTADFMNELLRDDNEKNFALFVLYYQSYMQLGDIFKKINYDMFLLRITNSRCYPRIIE